MLSHGASVSTPPPLLFFFLGSVRPVTAFLTFTKPSYQRGGIHAAVGASSHNPPEEQPLLAQTVPPEPVMQSHGASVSTPLPGWRLALPVRPIAALLTFPKAQLPAKPGEDYNRGILLCVLLPAMCPGALGGALLERIASCRRDVCCMVPGILGISPSAL